MAEPAARSGERLFARYAYAPNDLGYCGPADTAGLRELAATGHTAADVRAIAARFSGAWIYLTVLAELAGIADPLDEQVVRAYWTGGPLLDVVNRDAFGARLLERIKAAGAGRYWSHLTPGLLPEASATHGFHVFGVYPWTRLLAGPMPEQPLRVLDSCRVRWGEVVSVRGPVASVMTRRLTWDGRRLALGPQRTETVRLNAPDEPGFVRDVTPGDWLALHWDWACERLDPESLGYLRHWTDWQLSATNPRLARSLTRPAS